MGNNFKMLREKKGLSQQELGEIIGVTQQSVYAWERGDAMPKLSTAVALAEFYGVSIDFILGRDEIEHHEIQPTVSDDGLRTWTIDRVAALSDPELLRVRDFLAGLEAGQGIGSAPAAAPDPDDKPP